MTKGGILQLFFQCKFQALVYALAEIFAVTNLQHNIVVKISHQRFRPCQESSFIEMIPTIPHNLGVHSQFRFTNEGLSNFRPFFTLATKLDRPPDGVLNGA